MVLLNLYRFGILAPSKHKQAQVNKMEIKSRIEEAAKMFGVSVADMTCMANGVVNSIRKDNIGDQFINGAPELQSEICQAYAANEAKKYSRFAMSYMTNTECKKTVRQFVYSSLQAQQV